MSITKDATLSSGPSHTMPEKFEKAALVLRLCLRFTYAYDLRFYFSKTLFKPEEFENAAFAFWCGTKTELYENDDLTIVM